MIILVIVGFATVIGVIIIAVLETRRPNANPPVFPQQPSEKHADRKKG